MIESRAALLRGAGQPLAVETVAFADPGPSEVLVRMVAASVCHSDVHTMTNGAPHLPMIIGHEAAGVVEAVGPGVNDLQPGQKVALSFVPSCNACTECIRGRPVECVRGSAIGSDGRALDGTFKARSSQGEEVGQMVRLGAFSDRIVVHRDSCVAVDPATDLRVAALMSCGFLTGAGSVLNIAQTRPGDHVVVMGTGGVGIAAIQAAVVAGAASVVAVDVNETKLATARRFGATHTLNATDPSWPAKVAEVTGGRGADQAISCVGLVTNENVAQLMASLRGGGIGVVVGAGRAQVDLFEMGRKTLTRTLYGSHDPKADLVRFLELHRAGKFRIEEMISATYPLTAINDAVTDLKAGKNIRGVITFEETTEGAN